MGQQISISDEAFKTAKAEADRKGIKVSEAVSELVVTGSSRRAAVRRNAEKNRSAKPTKTVKAKAEKPAKSVAKKVAAPAKPAKTVKAPQKEAPVKAAGRAKGPVKKTAAKSVKKSAKDAEPAGVFLEPTPVRVVRTEEPEEDIVWD